MRSYVVTVMSDNLIIPCTQVLEHLQRLRRVQMIQVYQTLHGVPEHPQVHGHL